VLRGAHGRRNENHAVAAHKQHGNRPLRLLVRFLVGFVVDRRRRHGFLDVRQYHVQMLVVRLILKIDANYKVDSKFDPRLKNI